MALITELGKNTFFRFGISSLLIKLLKKLISIFSRFVIVFIFIFLTKKDDRGRQLKEETKTNGENRVHAMNKFFQNVCVKLRVEPHATDIRSMLYTVTFISASLCFPLFFLLLFYLFIHLFPPVILLLLFSMQKL